MLELYDFDLSLMHYNFLSWLDIHQQWMERIQEWKKFATYNPSTLEKICEVEEGDKVGALPLAQ